MKTDYLPDEWPLILSLKQKGKLAWRALNTDHLLWAEQNPETMVQFGVRVLGWGSLFIGVIALVLVLASVGVELWRVI